MNVQHLAARARARIRRPPAEVFAAFVDAASMSTFWFSRRDHGLKEGETRITGEQAHSKRYSRLARRECGREDFTSE
jgi:uncharacterized protein YndB with AHSA1/START domain